MKKLILAAVVCAIAAFPALAQIDMKCRLRERPDGSVRTGRRKPRYHQQHG